jgi:uncharacterized C2H2 Zn-finger protein
VSEHESQLDDVEMFGRCHVCALLFETEEDLLKHLQEAHGVKSRLQPPRAISPQLFLSRRIGRTLTPTEHEEDE